MNNITIFNNKLFGQVRSLIIDEKIYFVGKDIATALGYKNTRDAINRHCKGVVKHDVLDTTGFEQQMNIIPESDVYRLIFGSHLPEAEKFEKWVMEEVLPQLRQRGVYMTESATQEAITYDSKYRVNIIRKTFRETTNLEETWREFKELSQIERAAKRLTGKECINRCNQIIDELSKYKENNKEMPYYKHALYDAIIIEALNERNRLSNKSNGGIKSGMTKQIKNLEQELEQWQTYADELEDFYNQKKVWYKLPIHGFSTNFMFDEHHKPTKSYLGWLNRLPKELLPSRCELEAQGVSFDNRNLVVEAGFIHCESYDVDNLIKSTIDVIFGHHLKINDRLIIKAIPTTIATCDSTEQGEIHFCIYNTDEVPHISVDTVYEVINGQVEILGHKNNDNIA